MGGQTINPSENITTFPFDLHPDHTVQCALITQVTNAKDLRSRLIKGEIKGALIKASLIIDIFPVLLSCNKALHMLKKKSMKTRSIYTEILLNLYPTTSINESLKHMGISDSEENVLLLMIHQTNEPAQDIQDVLAMISGHVQPLSALKSICDADAVKKLYKITPDELTIGSLTDAVTCRVATKDAL